MEEQTRSYRSPLRRAQAAQTRELILEALTDLVLESGPDEVSIRALAERAGVSERTVYRYFPDREALHEGLADHLNERSETRRLELALRDLDELVAVSPTMFDAFDEVADEMRAVALLRVAPDQLSDDQRRRTELFGSLVAGTFPDLDGDARHRLLAAIRAIAGSHTWMRLRDEFGMTGRESGELVSWMLEALVARVRSDGPPPPFGWSADDRTR